MKKAFPYILLAVLAIAALLIRRCNNHSAAQNKNKNADEVDRNNALDRRLTFLEYTEHATCRMECGHVTAKMIEDGFQYWPVDTAASEFNAHPCPIFALTGYTTDSQHLRIVIGQCNFKTKVITCMPVDSMFDCKCPGVGSKYEHR